MNIQFVPILLPLLFAHILTDFLIISDSDVRQKDKSQVLIKHGLTVGIISYISLGIINAWDIALGIMFSHILLDTWKMRTNKGTSLSRFVIDQGAHIFILIIFSFAAAGYKYLDVTSLWIILSGKGFLQVITLLSGGILSILVGSFIVEYTFESFDFKEKKQTKPSSPENTTIDNYKNSGIKDGGKIIGYLERSLIFLFILAGYPAGIGFLIAAKSVFRFGELTDPSRRQQAEYIIIGTLLSILFGTSISFLTVEVLRLINLM